jgi:hypothetical protein
LANEVTFLDSFADSRWLASVAFLNVVAQLRFSSVGLHSRS